MFGGILIVFGAILFYLIRPSYQTKTVECESDQLLIIQHTTGSEAIAELWMKEDGEWELVRSGDAYVGKYGIGKMREGDACTPVGEFKIWDVFGILPDPGSKMPYIQADEKLFGCDENSPYYNRLIDTSVVHHHCQGEHIIDYVPEYNYAFSIDYNRDCVYGVGSNIYVHCKGRYPYTAGCIGIDEDFMKLILTTCDSTLHIRILE